MKENEDISGRAKGGVARAKALSPKRRSDIGKDAAGARWGYKVLHKGNFKDDFGLDVDCYVLDNVTKTAVISQRGMAAAIGLSRRGERLKSFVDSQTMANYIGRELRQKLDNPVVFQRLEVAAKNDISSRAHGYDASILIDLCEAIRSASADGKLSNQRYQKMVEHAQIITNASAKNGIQQLVYAVAGYNPTASEVIEAFKLYVAEEAKKYEREFPSELYAEWHRLYEIPVPDRGKPWYFKHLTINHIYYPLADSNGQVLELTRALKAQDGDRRKKLFQFLSDVGTRALRMHLGRVLEMCESSKDKGEYERKIVERFGGQTEFNLVIPDAPNA